MSNDSENLIAIIEQKKKASKKESLFSRLNHFRKKKESNDLLEFTKNFASLMKDGVPIVTSLETLLTKVENKRFREIISNSINEIKEGIPLYVCLKRHSDIFSDLYCDLIRIGEESGYIDEMFTKLADDYEKDCIYNSRQIGIWVKPIYVVIMGTICGIIIVSLIIPLVSLIKTVTPHP